MNTKLIIYRLITFTILPIAAILGVVDLVALVSALGNPASLLNVFILGSVVLYVFTSFIFFSQGVMNGKMFKPSLKDWIKVNAFVTLAWCTLVIIAALLYFTAPSFKKIAMDQLTAMRANASAAPVDKVTFEHAITEGFYILSAFAALLGIHIIITFGLLKSHKHLFGKQA